MNPQKPSSLVRIALMLFLCVAVFVPRGARGQTNYVLDFNGISYVSLALTNPPANNYTISAWVYLRQGASYNLPMGILSAATCGGSIELMIHSTTASATDPQYFELGACGYFNGQLTPCNVPLNTWTRIAVTLGTSNLVSLYVNGALIASYIDPNSGGRYAFGTAVTLAGNGSTRTFNGMMDEVQIWSRALSAAANGTGGAIYNGVANITYSTLSLNQCTVSGNSAASGSAGGIFNDDVDGEVTSLFNCIVSGNTPADFIGSFSGTPNLVGGNAHLAVLGNYGGPTQTMPLLPGSPAIDAAAASSFSTDQRGFPRVLGAGPDFGAVEGIFNPGGPGALTNVTQLVTGELHFGFTNYSGVPQTVVASTNVASPLNTWSNLGPALEMPVGSGQFQFADPQATNYPQRFYRVRSP